MSASVFYQCAGTVSEVKAGALECTTGWVMVSEPTFTLLTSAQVSGLLVAVLSIWAVWFVMRQIIRVLR